MSPVFKIWDGSNWNQAIVLQDSSIFETSGTNLAHVAANDPHPLYLLESAAAGLYAGSGYAYKAGAGLASSSETYNIGAGTGIIVNADTIEIDFSVVQASGEFGAGGGSTSYSGLTDVSATWASGQLARYDGAQWVPHAPVTIFTSLTLPDTNDTALMQQYQMMGPQLYISGMDTAQQAIVALSGYLGYEWVSFGLATPSGL